MRLVVDENLSIVWRHGWAHGDDVVHVTEVGLGNIDDETIPAWAVETRPRSRQRRC